MEETRQAIIENEEEQEWKNLSKNLIQTLPQTTSNGRPIHLYDGFWYPQEAIKGLLYFRKHFKPHQTDIFLSSPPKAGTNWLKALSFAIVNRSSYSLQDHPLLTRTTHQLVPFFEMDLFPDYHFPNLEAFTHPRIFATHAPYGSLPSSIKDSGNKIVYICRNPLDMFISLWFFIAKLTNPNMKTEEVANLDEAFETFFQGKHVYGPFWDHILGYWQASIERPDKVLFLKYEDLKKDNVMYIKKQASFLGFPFSEEEEKQGLVEDISKLCSFENMKNLEVNKNGRNPAGLANDIYLRKGKVGDFRNYLSPDKVEKMKKLVQEKFGESGLSFDFA